MVESKGRCSGEPGEILVIIGYANLIVFPAIGTGGCHKQFLYRVGGGMGGSTQVLVETLAEGTVFDDDAKARNCFIRMRPPLTSELDDIATLFTVFDFTSVENLLRLRVPKVIFFVCALPVFGVAKT
ncbi:hypothetical protein FAIPA1_690001 [Frankia sp. AiPs1]